MRKLVIFWAVAALVGLQAHGAGAQRGGGFGMGGGMGRGGLGMLRLPEVQKELNMTADQVSGVDKAQEQFRKASQDLLKDADPQSLSPEQRLAMRDIQEKAVGSVLDSTQIVRYHQLELQQQGPSALNRKDIALALALSDDEQKGVAAAISKGDEARRAAMDGANFQDMTMEERTALRTKMDGVRKDTDAKLVALLTEDQRSRWTAMLGAPFTFPAPTGMGRRRGGGQGGGDMGRDMGGDPGGR